MSWFVIDNVDLSNTPSVYAFTRSYAYIVLFLHLIHLALDSGIHFSTTYFFISFYNLLGLIVLVSGLNLISSRRPGWSTIISPQFDVFRKTIANTVYGQ